MGGCRFYGNMRRISGAHLWGWWRFSSLCFFSPSCEQGRKVTELRLSRGFGVRCAPVETCGPPLAKRSFGFLCPLPLAKLFGEFNDLAFRPASVIVSAVALANKSAVTTVPGFDIADVWIGEQRP